MDSNSNARQSGAATGLGSGVGSESNANLDWRSLLPLDARQRIVNRFMDTLKRHLPEGSGNELQNIAVRFEEKIYRVATSQPDYIRKVSLKMLSMENKTQPGLNPSLPNQNPMDPGEGMTSQQPSLNPGQSLGMSQIMNQPPAWRQQQPLVQSSHKMRTAVPGGPSGATITPMSGPSTSNSYPMSRPSGTSGPYWFPPYGYVFEQETATAATAHATTAAGAGGSGMMNSVQQQPVGQGGSFQQQSLMRQQPQPTMQNPTVPMQWTNNVTNLQQQQLQMQQNQLQQSQMQQNHVLYQQMMLGQQQNQLLGSGGADNMNNMQQRQMQMQRQGDLLQQQQSQLQSQQQQLPQQQHPSMMQQREMQMPQQQMQGSPALLQTQNSNAIDPQRQQQQQFIPQQQQPQQQQRVLQDVASSPESMDSTAQTGNPRDWQEEMYQRLKYLKDTYFADLREIHQKLSMKLSQLDSIVPSNARGGEQIEKMKHFKMVLERMMAVLQLGKHSMQIGLKDKLSLYENQILSILQNHRKAPQQQPQAGAPSEQPGLQSQQLPQQQNTMKTRKCKICKDCVHKRRNSN